MNEGVEALTALRWTDDTVDGQTLNFRKILNEVLKLKFEIKKILDEL